MKGVLKRQTERVVMSNMLDFLFLSCLRKRRILNIFLFRDLYSLHVFVGNAGNNWFLPHKKRKQEERERERERERDGDTGNHSLKLIELNCL